MLRQQYCSEESRLQELHEERERVGRGRVEQSTSEQMTNDKGTGERQGRDNPLAAAGANEFGDERVKSKVPEDSGRKSHDSETEDDSSESGDTIGTMQLEELAPPTATPHTHVNMSHCMLYTLYTHHRCVSYYATRIHTSTCACLCMCIHVHVHVCTSTVDSIIILYM